MAFETVHLLKFVEFEIDTDVAFVFELKTDQPGDAMAVRFSRSFNSEDTTTGRRVIRFRLRGTTQGKLLRALVYCLGTSASEQGVAKIYGGRVWARPVGATAGNWGWYDLPIRATPEPYSVAVVPGIRPTEEIYAVANLPVRETNDHYATALLPIRETAEEYQRGNLPFHEKSIIPEWVLLPMDAID